MKSSVVAAHALLAASMLGCSPSLFKLIDQESTTELRNRLKEKEAISQVWEMDKQQKASPILYAVHKGRREALLEMFDAGVNPDVITRSLYKREYDATAMTDAIIREKEGVVEFLLDHGADANFCVKDTNYLNPLVVAILQDQLDIVKLLVKRGADPNLKLSSTNPAETPMSIALVRQRSRIASYLANAGGNTTALSVKQQAELFSGSLDTDDTLFVQRLLKGGYDPNSSLKRIEQPIYMTESAYQGRAKVLQEHPGLSIQVDNEPPSGTGGMLMMGGSANVEIRMSNEVSITKDAMGNIYYQLMIHGSQFNCQKVKISYMLYPLMAVRSEAMARILCSYGAIVEKKDGLGMTALCRAAIRANNDSEALGVVRFLASKGAKSDMEWLEFSGTESPLGSVVLGYSLSSIRQLSHYGRIKKSLGGPN